MAGNSTSNVREQIHVDTPALHSGPPIVLEIMAMTKGNQEKLWLGTSHSIGNRIVGGSAVALKAKQRIKLRMWIHA